MSDPSEAKDSPEQAGDLHPKPSDLHGKYLKEKEKIKSIKSKPAGGFDQTPLPDAPPGYTIKITFHQANLPIADAHLMSSDPFIHATLTAEIPKRHKEDPPLTHRTRTCRRTTKPVWNEDWIVANVPASGFLLKCRIYDEDWPDHDDRLGNVTIRIPSLDENWQGFGPQGRTFNVKKRSGSKRAYIFHCIRSQFSGEPLTPTLQLGIEVLGKSDPPHAQMYTVGPTTWVKHFSPMIGRLTGVKVNKDENNDASSIRSDDRKSKKFNFQATQIQLNGPVPPELYHRYVEFRPLIGKMFSSKGLRGRILNAVLHKQHRRIYNYDSSTEYGSFEPCTEEASLQFLRMAHFDEGGRIFTYVITLDGLMRFTETGKEFGIDLLSKHSMHSDVATYIACSGEFFIRRHARSRHHHAHRQHSSSSQSTPTHPPTSPLPDGPPNSAPPPNPNLYQLIIDNDSGTYRPDKSILPLLQKFLEKNFPGLQVRAMHCEDEELVKMKKEQLETKKREGAKVRMVLNRSPTSSSFSSDDESRLGDLEAIEDEFEAGVTSKKEKAFDLLHDPSGWKEYVRDMRSKRHGKGKGKGKEKGVTVNGNQGGVRDGEGQGKKKAEGESSVAGGSGQKERIEEEDEDGEADGNAAVGSGDEKKEFTKTEGSTEEGGRVNADAVAGDGEGTK